MGATGPPTLTTRCVGAATMTDYSEPVTPAEVCERIREGLDFHAKSMRRSAEILLAKADAIEQMSRDVVFNEKQRYERYQPLADADNGSPAEQP